MVALVMPLVGVLPVVVSECASVRGVSGRWPLLGVGPRHSWQRAWQAALLAGLLLLLIR